MRVLAAVIVLACGTLALLGCGSAGASFELGCRGTCAGCNSDADCCGSNQCFHTFPYGEGRCANSSFECSTPSD